MSVELRLERDRLAPGDWIGGLVVVHAAVPNARSVEVIVGYYERTRDYRETVLEGRTGPLHTGPVAAGTQLPFRLQLPANAAPPYSSHWGELFWEADAKVDVPRGKDLHARWRLLVLPAGVGEDQIGGEAPGGRTAGDALGLPGVLAAAARPAGAAPAGAPAAAPGANAAPGSFPGAWYPDPWLEKRLRWWDGNAWTGQTAD